MHRQRHPRAAVRADVRHPLSGWLYDSASGLRPFRWFGLVDVPKLSGPTRRLSRCHMPSTNTVSALIAVVLAHAGAAFTTTCSSAMRPCPACCRAAGASPQKD